MEFRLPFNSAKPPFYVSLNDEREVQTWEGPYGSHDVDFNWGSEWNNIDLRQTSNKDATNAVEVLYLKDIPKRDATADNNPYPDEQFWLTNSRVQMQRRSTDYFVGNNKIELGIRECDTKHRPWDGLTIEVTGYITYVSGDPPSESVLNDVVFEIVLAKDDFQITPVMAEIERPYGLGYDPDYKVFWYQINGPELPEGAFGGYYTIEDILSVTPSSPFEPPTPA